MSDVPFIASPHTPRFGVRIVDGAVATAEPKAESRAVRRASPDLSLPAHVWTQRFARRLWLSDLVVLVAVVFGAQIVWFGNGGAQVAIREDSRLSEFSYWLFSAGLVAAWMWALSLSDSRSYRIIGTGSTEYTRVAASSFRLFGVIAIFAFLLRVDIARGFLLISLPLGVVVLLVVRRGWRKWLVAQRRRRSYLSRVLLVGSATSVAKLAHELGRSPSAGYRVVGACIATGKIADTIPGTDIAVMGNLNSIERAIAATSADTVAITSTDDLPSDKVREISWGLEAGRQHLVLAPNLVDIAGPRIHIRPVAGLPLIHVETPRFSQGQLLVKRSLDLSASVLGVVALSPLLLLLALAVRASTPGPALFRQIRVGHGGKEFCVYKFRTMVQGAEEQLPELGDGGRDSGNEVLFKMKNDPRITPVGRWMRKYSFDELPQLFNVIGGKMSLVGPRPPLPTEVEQYADHVHRRFLVKPGITGLWQVSGRSRLSWEESVRIDLAYVENWTLLGDLVILSKTVKAAAAPGESAH